MNEFKDSYPQWNDFEPWSPEAVIADCDERLKQGCDKDGLEPDLHYLNRKDRWRECILGLMWMAKQSIKQRAH